MSIQTGVDFGAIKARQQKTWASGDYAMVGGTLVVVAENLCEAAGLKAGQRVLDVATGSGNAALAAARRFCDVTGVDYVPELLSRASERAVAERLEIDLREGDAEALPFEDASFDAVLSTFGAMFAPDHEQTAAELARVCRPGGTIAMANWTPEGFIGRLFKLTGSYVAPPAGLRSPVLWGSEEHVRGLFGDRVSALHVTRRHFSFRFRSAVHFIEFFRDYYGPTMKAFEALGETGREAYARDILDLVGCFNRSGDETMVAPSEYLEVVATRR